MINRYADCSAFFKNLWKIFLTSKNVFINSYIVFEYKLGDILLYIFLKHFDFFKFFDNNTLNFYSITSSN